MSALNDVSQSSFNDDSDINVGLAQLRILSKNEYSTETQISEALTSFMSSHSNNFNDNDVLSDESMSIMNANDKQLMLYKKGDKILNDIDIHVKNKKEKILLYLLYKTCNENDPTRIQFLKMCIKFYENNIISTLNFLTKNSEQYSQNNNLAVKYNDDNLFDDELRVSIPNKYTGIYNVNTDSDYDSNNNNNDGSVGDIKLSSIMLSRYERDFIEISKIGFGGFGVVYKCQHRLDGMIYAVKKIIFNINYQNKSKIKKQILREVKSLALLPHHSNILGYYSCWIQSLSSTELVKMKRNKLRKYSNGNNNNNNNNNKMELIRKGDNKYINMVKIKKNWDKIEHYSCLFLQTNYCGKYTLKDYINKDDRNVTYSNTMNIFSQILYGLGVIHKQKLLHRDIKPENIFLKPYNYDNDTLSDISQYTVIIGDFGLSKIITDNVDFYYTNSDDDNILNDGHTTGLGTGLYSAPEQLNVNDNDANTYDLRADIYSLGIILWELIQNPFDTMYEKMLYFKSLKNNNYKAFERIDAKIFKNEIKLIQTMMNKDYKKRPFCHELLSLQCIKEYIFKHTLSHVIPNTGNIDNITSLKIEEYKDEYNNDINGNDNDSLNIIFTNDNESDNNG